MDEQKINAVHENSCKTSGADALVGQVKKSFDDVVNELTAETVEIPTKEQEKRKILLELLDNLEVKISENIPEDVYTMKIAGVPTLALEGINIVTGKAKQGKTRFVEALVSTYISDSGKWGQLERIGDTKRRVWYVDTEQKRYDSQCLKRRILDLAHATEEEVGDNLKVTNLRSAENIDNMKELIEVYLDEYHPDVWVVDGIVDLLENFNDVTDSQKLVKWLMQLADSSKGVFIGVLHTNKALDDHNMRGHLGTMAEQKSDNVIEVTKEKDSSFATVSCNRSRQRPFDSISFAWDENGNIVPADEMRLKKAQQKAEQAKAKREEKSSKEREDKKKSLFSILNAHGGTMKRKDLTDAMMKNLNRGHSTISTFISSLIKEKEVFENGELIQSTPQTDMYSGN